MDATRIARLDDRGVVSVTGPDAEKLLQNIITADMDWLAEKPAIHAALLIPQGKMMFEFFVVKAGDGFRLETSRAKAADLVKRLGLYKLRANVVIADDSAGYEVLAAWGEAAPQVDGAIVYADPRLPALGWRIIAPRGAVTPTAEAADYHEHRIGLGVPEAEKDYPLGDAYPHEALLDQLGGVSFKKGCYVGQEVVSRMQHRGTARKRVVRVVAASALPAPGAEIGDGETVVGTLGSVAGHEGLALVRLDRAAEVMAKGHRLAAGPVAIEIEVPPWASFKLEAPKPAAGA